MNRKENYSLSIIIPIFNGEECINRCISSFINYVNDDIEIMLIDDGSKDRSRLYCEKIIEKHSNCHVVYKYKENQGVSSARNLGLSLARGKWIYFLDMDDYLINCEQLFSAFSFEKEIDFILFRTQLKRDGEFVKTIGMSNAQDYQYKQNLTKFYSSYQNGYFFECHNKFYRKSIIDTSRLQFDIKYRIGEDLLFNLQYLNQCNVVSHKKEETYSYETGHSDAATYTLDCQWFSANFKALELINTNFFSTEFRDSESTYKEFIKRYKRVFLRMLIVFDNKKLVISEKDFIQYQLNKLEITLAKNSPQDFFYIKLMNRFLLTVPILLFARKLKKFLSKR